MPLFMTDTGSAEVKKVKLNECVPRPHLVTTVSSKTAHYFDVSPASV